MILKGKEASILTTQHEENRGRESVSLILYGYAGAWIGQ